MSEEPDESVERLAPDVRQLLGRIWAGRAMSELGAGSGFAQVIVGLYAFGAHPEVLSLATRAAHQEVEHARMCHALAELYLGEPVPMPIAKKVGMPPHEGASDPLRATLHVIGLCCFNETIAVEFVARCRDAAEAPAVARATSVHLRDEIGHARVGWAHLGSDRLDAADRRAIRRWMPRLVKANGEMWLERISRLPERGVPGHGYPSVRDLHRGVRKALQEVVIPGLAEAGIDVSSAAREARAL